VAVVELQAAVEQRPGQAGGASGEQVFRLAEATPASWL